MIYDRRRAEMKKWSVGSIALALVCLCNWSSMGQEPKPTMEAAGFIAGCWEINRPDKGVLTQEQWMAPAGGAMIGMARNVRNRKMASYEFLRLVLTDSGLHYIAKPSQSKSETAFKLVKWAANEAVFENPEHDFPQRIIYRRPNSKTLNARIEGTMNGKATGMDYPFTKAKCG